MRLLVLVCLVLVALDGLSVPAYPKRIAFQLENGNEVFISIRGDETRKWAISEDEYTLLPERDVWVYAQEDENGYAVPSSFRLVAEKDKDALTKDFLKSQKKRLPLRMHEELYNQRRQHCRVCEEVRNTDGGSDVADGTAYYGIDFVLPDDDATTKTGGKFKGWIVNGTQYNAGATVSITEDTVVKAVWERETYTVTFDTVGGSAIANGTATFGYGFTLPGANAVSKAGHTLKGWIVNGTEYAPGTAVSGITEDTVIKAVWGNETYTITFERK